MRRFRRTQQQPLAKNAHIDGIFHGMATLKAVLAAAMALLLAVSPSGARTTPAWAQSPAPPTAVPTAPPTANPPVPQQPRTPTPLSTFGPPPPTETYVPTRPATATPTLVARQPTETPQAGASTATASIAAEPEIAHEERPIIIVEGFEADPGRPAAGSQFHLSLHVRNVGEHTAENVELVLSSDTFLPAGQGAVLHVNLVKRSDDATVDTDLTVAAGATAGVHALNIALRWDDSHGGSYTDQTSIGIETGGAGTQRPVIILAGSRLPGRVAPGAPFTLVLDLMNTGAREARNLICSVTNGPLSLQGTGTGEPISLPAGGRATVNLRVQAAQMQSPGAATQTVELRYDDPDGVRYTESQTLGVNVTGDAAIGPMPMVDSYSLDPPELHPGSVFELTMNVMNTGIGDALTTRLALGGGSAPASSSSGASSSGGTSLGVFAPLETSNVRFLNRLKAGETRTVTQKMVVDGAAKPGVYVLTVGFSFVDPNGQAMQSSEVVSLLVSRPVNLTLNPTTMVTQVLEAEAVPLSVELVNAGSAAVNVNNAEVTGDKLIAVTDGASRFIGQLDSGASDTVEATLLPQAVGKSVVTVVVNYTDDFNRPQKIERKFEFQVEKAPEISPQDTLDKPKDDGNIILRILKGLLGLGASPPSYAQPGPSIGGGNGSSGSGSSGGNGGSSSGGSSSGAASDSGATESGPKGGGSSAPVRIQVQP